MNRRMYLFLSIGLVLSSLLCSGCQKAQMYLNPSLQSGMDLLPVHDRQGLKMLDESFSFPPYAVTEVDRGWKVTTRWGILGFGNVTSEQDYSFLLQRDGWLVREVQCGTSARWKEFKGDNVLGTGGSLTWILSNNTQLICVLKDADHNAACSLGMQPGGEKGSMEGTLVCGADRMVIAPTFRLSGTSIPYTTPSGYLISSSDRVVAAVDVLNEGRVWLEHSQPEQMKDTLAAAASVIFLYNELLKM